MKGFHARKLAFISARPFLAPLMGAVTGGKIGDYEAFTCRTARRSKLNAFLHGPQVLRLDTMPEMAASTLCMPSSARPGRDHCLCQTLESVVFALC